MSKRIAVIDNCMLCPYRQADFVCEHYNKYSPGEIPDDCPLVEAIGYVEPVGNMISWEDDSDE